MTRRPAADADRMLSRWFFACALLVAAMVALGGYTRLSHAGLSITEWKPVTGAIPPLSRDAWLVEYAKYRASPEFLLLHHWMSLDDFKGIYWIEWSHRLLGRLTGAAVLLPLIYFARTRALRGRLLGAVLGVFALGALQGVMGWFMVASGLVRDPRVSHFRLTAHLLLAVLIFVALTSLGLRASRGLDAEPRPALPGVRAMAGASLAGTVVTVAWGGLVAGLKAGLVSDTFPLMHGRLVPEGLLTLRPAATNLVSNALAVQFVHRTLAYATAALVIATAATALRAPGVTVRVRRAAWMLVVAVGLQVTLGALTVISHVNPHVALAHQCNALLILLSALRLMHAAEGVPAATAP